LTRASIDSALQEMDRRVKPGNDAGETVVAK